MAQQQSPIPSSVTQAGPHSLTARLDALNAVTVPADVPGGAMNRLSGQVLPKEQARRKGINAKGRVVSDVDPNIEFVGQEEQALHVRDVPSEATWGDSVAASAGDGDAVLVALNDAATDAAIGGTSAATQGAVVSGSSALLSSATLFSPMVLGGVGIGVAAVAASGGGGSKSTPAAAPAPAPAPVTVPTPTDVKVADTDGDKLPNISGDATPNALITIKDPTGATHTATAASNGHFELEIALPSQPLGTWEVTASDASGNVSQPASVQVTDLTAPDVPVIKILTDFIPTPSGPMPDGSLTNDAFATISGTAEPDVTVTLRNAGAWLGTTIADALGQWSFSPSVGYSYGLNQITAQATDASGNVSVQSAAFKFTLDDKVPDPAQLQSMTDTVELFTGAIVAGTVTNDARPTLTGKGEVGAGVIVRDGARQVGAGAVGADGYWSVRLNTTLSEGSHRLVVAISDKAGNVSTGVDTVTFTVDTKAPLAPNIDSVTQTQASISSDVPKGSITKSAQPVFAGSLAEPGTTIILMEGTSTLGTAKVDSSGNWAITPTIPLVLGVRHVVAVAMDEAGNTSAPSSAFDVNVVTGGTPTFTTITAVLDDTSSTAVVVQSGGATKDQTLTVQGTAIPNSTVTLYSDTSELGIATADANGIWSLTLASGTLIEGAHALTAKATDAQRHVGDPSNVYQIVIDITAPDAVNDLRVTDDVPEKIGPIANGDVTNDATPTFAGTAEPGATVSIREGKIEVGTAKVGSDGKWTFTPIKEMAEGPHALSIVAIDAVGNVGKATPFNFTIDRSTALVSIDSVLDSVGPKTGFVAMGTATDDQQPIVSGKAVAGGTVTLYDGLNVLGTAVAGSDGVWSIHSTTLDPGLHGLTATVQTVAGDVATTRAFPLVIDIHKPTTPTIDVADDDAGPIKGSLTNGQPTDDTTPTLTGTTDPGTTVAVFEGDKRLGDAIVDKWGNWYFTPTTPLNPGTHAIKVVATDAVGTVSDASLPWSVVIDKEPLAAVTTIDAVTDDQEPGLGLVARGTTTNDARPVVSGTAEAGTTVTLFDGTEKIGSGIANDKGVWSITPDRLLVNGNHHLTAISSNAVGNAGQSSAAYDFTVLSGGAPTGIAITGVMDDTGSVTRLIARDGTTKDRTPTVEGTAQPGETVTLYSETNDMLGKAVVGTDGHWRITSTIELSAGSHGLRAVATDASGHDGRPTAAYPITVELSTGAAQNLTLTDHVGPKTGPVAEGESIDDSTPTFAGTAEPGATITVKDGEVVLGTTEVRPDGTWSFTYPLKDGHHSLTATVTDMAGNVAVPEKSIGFYVATVDVLVSINEVYDAVALFVGPVQPGGATNDSHPKVSGKATPGGTVTLYVDGIQVGTALADAHTGKWTVSLSGSNALKDDGPHTLTATVTSQGGVESAPTRFDMVIDHTVPGAAHIEKVIDKVGSMRGAVPDGGATDDTTPTLSGVADPDSKVSVFDNGEWIGDADADAYGNWHLTPTTAWNPGNHALTLTSTDGAGNVTPTPKAWTVVIDVQAPAAPTIDRIMDNRDPNRGPVAPGTTMDDPQPVVSGTAEKGATVTLWDGMQKIGSGVADAITGLWSITPDRFLLNGDHHLTATVTDAVGNTGKPSGPFDFKLAAGGVPTPTTITNVIDDDNADGVARNIQPGGYTDDRTPTVEGTAIAGSTVTLYDENRNVLGTTVADANGQWRLHSTILDKGPHTLIATGVDPVTKASSSTASFLLNIDADAPNVAKDLSLVDNVGPDVGQILNGATTDDATPTFSGTGEIGATVDVWDGKEHLGSTVVKPDGTWSFTPELENGQHSLTATLTDKAGNVSDPTSPKSFHVDAGKVLVSIDEVYDNVPDILGPVMPGTSTNDQRPVVSGKATRGGWVTLYEGTEVLGATVADSRTGEWSIRVPDALAQGAHVFEATVTPASGIESARTSFDFVVDSLKPPQPKITMVSDNVGPIQGDHTDVQPLTTDDTTPALRGTAEPYSTVAIFVDNRRMDDGEIQTDAHGAWRYTLKSPLAVGANAITVRAIDAAGNVSDVSSPWTVIIDVSKVDPLTGIVPSIEEVVNDQGPTPAKVLFGTTTDDDTPTFKGKGDPNTVVVLMDGSQRLGTANVGMDGKWEFTPSKSMDNGEHRVAAATLSPTGNMGDTSPVFEFNLLAGGVPTGTAITAVFDDTHVDKPLFVERDGFTHDATPVVQGTAAAGMTITLYNERAEVLGKTVADPNGQWRIVVAGDKALSEGAHALRAVATDASGHRSDPTGAYNLTVDLKAPVLIGTVLDDNVAPKIGGINDGDVTDDSTPTFKGMGEPGAKITVVLDGVEVLGTTEVNADGSWSLPPPRALVDGPHTLSVTAEDKAGNVSDPVTVHFTLDRSNLVISLDSVTDAVAPVVGPLQSGDATNDPRPTASGRTMPNTVVKVYDETNALLGSVVSDSRGDWSFQLTANLTPGQHSLYATVVKATGEVASSNVFAFAYDVTPPKAPTIDRNDDDVGSIQGDVSNGAPTDDTTPTLYGTAEAGATITLYEGTKEIGRAKADPFGNWHTTLQTPLNPGTHSIVAVAVDRAGNASPRSNVWDVVVDVKAPAIATQITEVMDNQAPQTGPLKSGDTTDETQPTVSGTAEAGATVTLWDGTERIGSAIADAVTGKWTITPTQLLINGDHRLTAIATDAAGNAGQSSAAFELHVFRGGSATATAITNVVDDTDLNHLVSIAQGGLTSDATPVVNGTAQAGATVRLYDKDGTLLATTVATAGGEWRVATSTLAPGGHEITAESTAANGDVLARTGPRTLYVDPHVPTVATALKLYDDQQPKTGDIPENGTTDDSTPTFSGTAEAGATVTVYDGVERLGTTKADAAGNWSFTHDLKDGAHSYTATVTSLAGKTGPATQAMNFVVNTDDVIVSIDRVADDVPPITGAVTPGGVTDDQRPTISGKAIRGGTVTVYDGISTVVGTTVADIHTGRWTLQVDALHELGEGVHTLRATVTPVGGVESAAQTFAFTVDRTAPTVPEIKSVVDDVGSTTGPLSQNAYTDDATPTLSGKGDPNTVVAILDNGKEIGRADVNGAGLWSFTVDAPPVNPGTHKFTAVGIDAAGNASKESAAWAVIVDTSGTKLPSGPLDPLSDDVVAVTYITRDSGPKTGDFVTNDNTLVFGGTTDAVDGSRVDVRLDGKHLAYVTVTGGAWSYDHTKVALAEGTHVVRADLVDLADNVAKSSDVQKVIVDTQGDKLPEGTRDPLLDKTIAVIAVTRDSGISPVDFITNDPTLVFTGTSDAADGTYLALRIDGRFIDYAQVFGGLWRYDYSKNTLAIGTYTVRADLVDLAGNTVVASKDRKLEVDIFGDRFSDGTHDPLADQTIAVTLITIDSGISDHDFITNDPTLVIGGTSSAPNGSHVAVWVNGELLAYREVTNGVWSYDYTAKTLDAGYYSVRADLVDVAGNIASSSPVRTIEMDRSGSEFVNGTHDPLADQTIAVTAIYEDNGVRSDDFYTSDRTLVFTGTSNAPNGSHVAVWLNGNFLDYVAISGGAWSYDYRDHSLGDGYYNLRADLVDVAGNIAASSPVRGFAVDNSGALLPDGTRDPLGDAAIAVTSIDADTGVSGSDFITNATSVTAHGTGSANAWIQVHLDGKHLGDTQIDGSGNWSYGMATPQGNHTISANYIDLAGNVVPGPVGSHGMTVDTTAPEIVAILTTYEAVAHGPKTYSFEFSEAVAGFDASDLHLTSATLSSFTKIDDTHYSVTITPAGYGKGTMNMSVDDNSYTDLAGNGGRGEAGTPMPYSIAPPDVIDLKPGKIIDPREINGKYLYYWDKNGNGLYDDLVTYSEVQFLQASHPELVTPHVGFSSPRSDEEKRLITWLEAAKSEKGVDLFAWGAEEWYSTPDATPPGWTHPIDYPGKSFAFYSNYVMAPGFGDNPAMYHQNALAHAVFEVTF